MSDVELRPCPFCGLSGFGRLSCDFGGELDEEQVTCDQCDAVGPGGNSVDAANTLWNTRPEEDRLRAEVEALRALVAELEWVGAHDWKTYDREGWTVCSRCGMVRNYDRETPCRGTTPPVAPRTERRELGELAKELDAAATNLAEQSVRYRHRRTGKTYVLTSVSLRESDLTLLVHYVPTECRGVTFTRPLVEFQEKFEEHGVKR